MGEIILRDPARADGMRWTANRVCLACGYEWRKEQAALSCSRGRTR